MVDAKFFPVRGDLKFNTAPIRWVLPRNAFLIRVLVLCLMTCRIYFYIYVCKNLKLHTHLLSSNNVILLGVFDNHSVERQSHRVSRQKIK